MGFQCLFVGARACRTYWVFSRPSSAGISLLRTLGTASVQHGKRVETHNASNLVRWLTRTLRAGAPKTTAIQCRNSYVATSSAVAKDVVLFEHDRSRFFRLLAIFCGGQLLFWTYLAQFAFTGLKDTRESGGPKQKVRAELGGWLSFDMNLGSNSWRFGFTLACLGVGFGIGGLGLLFARRSVSRVVLHKGGTKVSVWTQSPLGPDRARQITVPISQVACHAHRHESASFIPLKVKGHKLYFLLDKEGKLNNARLFDVTVGAYRPF